MHLHDNSTPEEARSLRCRPGESFVFGGRVCDLAAVVATIEARPQDFEFGKVRLDELFEQIRGETKLNFHYVATMARARAGPCCLSAPMRA